VSASAAEGPIGTDVEQVLAGFRMGSGPTVVNVEALDDG
jgi:hypothetical protein